MSDKATSRTEQETWVEEALAGAGPHFKTTISDPRTGEKVEGRGSTAEEAEQRASEKWDQKHS